MTSAPLVSSDECELVTPPVDPTLYALTFPRYHPLLDRAGRGVVALIARLQGRPIGLALATLDPADHQARLLSIAVSPAHRRRRVATVLLDRLRDELRASGARSIHGVFRTGTPSTVAVERLLATCGWSTPRDRCVLYRTDPHYVEGDWVFYDPPDDCRFFPWCELTPAQRRSVEALGLDETETPFYEERLVEPANSVGLARGDDEVVGWMVTHRVLPDLVRYSRLWVHPELRGQTAGQAVLGRAIVLHRGPLHDEAPHGVWNIAVDNVAMRQLQEKRLSGRLVSVERSRGALLALREDGEPS